MSTKVPPASAKNSPPVTGKPAPANTDPVPDTSDDQPWLGVGGLVDFAKLTADKLDLGLADRFGRELSSVGLSVDATPGAPPVLKRPVVMIPGFTMDASSYDRMALHLAGEPRNGPVAVYSVADGQFHSGSSKGPAMAAEDVRGAKIFEVQYSNPMAPSTEKSIEIGNAMRAIHAATGQGTVDVVAHSAGCTDFRQYLQGRSTLDRAQPAIGEVVLVGPASHGTFMGNVGASPLGIPLGVQEGGRELELGSSDVQALNDTWPNQRGQVRGDVTIVGISGAPTPGPGGVSTGDGFMPLRDLAMPDAKLVILRGLNPTPVAHLTEIGKGGVLSVVDRVLGTGPSEK
jgi:pimeloyl-ACP methyl ester carboxylesterase